MGLTSIKIIAFTFLTILISSLSALNIEENPVILYPTQFASNNSFKNYLNDSSSIVKDSICLQILPATNELTNNISLLKKDNERGKKFISALFAFPFPFGFIGAHRIMLGTKPWVPVVYVATFGGCFGLLPFIDFCVILFSKDIKEFENNSNIFMWVK